MVEMEERKAGESDGYVRIKEAREMLGVSDMVDWNRVRSSLNKSSIDDRIFYSVKSIKRAIEKRNNPLPSPSESDC